MAATYKTYDISQQQKNILFSIRKQINVTSHVQYFVEKYFRHTYLEYIQQTDLQIPQAALTNSARVLTTYVSICSFIIIARHTFSVTFKSGDRAGQVVTEILFYSFQLVKIVNIVPVHVILEYKSSHEILSNEKALNFHPKFAYLSLN